MNKRSLYFTASIFLLATLACGAGQVFATRHVYSITPGSASEFYDAAANKILQDDVWVFYPNGTYAARVKVDGQQLARSGKYEANEGIIDLDVTYQGDLYQYTDRLFLSDDGSRLEWHRSSGTITYFPAQ